METPASAIGGESLLRVWCIHGVQGMRRCAAMTRRVQRLLLTCLSIGLPAAWSCSHAPRSVPAPTTPPPPSAPPAPPPPPAPTWPKEVDTKLTAPGGFRLIAVKGDEALVTVMGTIEYVEPRTKHEIRARSSYLARIDLRTGCMLETFDFPTVSHAEMTGSVRAALAVLATPSMGEELARARTLAAAFGPGTAPIRVSPDGKNAVLEANNQIYWAKDGKSEWVRVGTRAGRNPVLTADGAHVVVNLGGGAYRPNVMDLATGKLHPVSGKRSAEMAAGDLHPLADGAVLAVETNGINHGATRICVTRIDTQKYVEKELVCVPANVISASLSELSADERYLALMVEDPQHDRVVVYDTKTWEKVTDGAGNPTYRAVDVRGRVAWDDGKGTVVMAHGNTTDPVELPAAAPGAPRRSFVGFIGDKLVVGHPRMAPFEDEKPLLTLADVDPCGHLTVIDAP